jgi:serine/threonine protein kinase/Tfp pilus assembly protein PilF
MQLTSGTRLGAYEIRELLGAGGMGEVYRARDSRLDRDVALKLLPAAFENDPERLARFEREARMVAALNHPHIVVLHSIEEHDGMRFLTMELVEGESLASRVAPGGLPLEPLIGLAIPLADALVAAHAKGVVHRDLKPGNVMVSRDGRLKVLDFGLAKLAAPLGDAALTQELTVDAPLSGTGTVMGTVPYMAPEQLRGEAVDARTDLFAFGIILYELAAGRRPFTGASAVDVSSAILRDTPPALGDQRSDLSPGFERVVRRCLEKSPGARYQTAQELLDALRSLTGPVGDANDPAKGTGNGVSIGILPFANRSGNADDEYFSDGLADELLNVLVKIHGLRVAARASSFHFKGRNATIAEVGAALNVATVLDGSVRRAGGRVRIAVQLVNVTDGYHLWSETYDRTLDDIFAVQDDIAHSVVGELRRTLLGEDSDSETRGRTRAEVAAAVANRPTDPEAYDLYLRGRYLLSSTDDGPSRAQEMFRRAIERAPTFALPYAGLGDAYVLQSWLNSRDRSETVVKARAALARALELDPHACEARVLSGQIKSYFDWDWAGAEAEFRKAIELNPGSDLAHREYSSFLNSTGRYEEGIASARVAQSLDPLSVNATHELGYQLLSCGRLEDAMAEFRRALDLNPNWIWGNIKLGMAYALNSDRARALVCTRRADELLGGEVGGPLTQAWLARIEQLCGDAGRVHATISRLHDEAEAHYVEPVAQAWLHYALGDYNAAITALENGYELRSPTMAFILQTKPYLWKEMSAHPRYASLLDRMAFPQHP